MPTERKSTGFNGRNTPDMWGKDPKTETGKHNVPIPPQSTWELALCELLVLSQGWNITQTLASLWANSLHFWTCLTENWKYILWTRIPFSLYHTGCLFCRELGKTHCILSTDGDPFPSSPELFFLVGRALCLFERNILNHYGWRVTPKGMLK